ncbi:MAG: hypothetical protein Q7K40_04295 [bacterium]|nr:hypothetical protein [bacterium]
MVKNCEGDKHTHDPKVNESGIIECAICRILYLGEEGEKSVKQLLKAQHGEFGKERFRELMSVKRLVRKCETQNLRPMLYGYEDDTMDSTSRLFYAQK